MKARVDNRERNLRFAHFGHGITVYDLLNEVLNDYQTVAFIYPSRKIHYRVELPNKYKKQIQRYARWEDLSVSVTQPEQKVFIERPVPDEDVKYPCIYNKYKY